MYFKVFTHILVVGSLLIASNKTSGQTRLILNGAKINITAEAQLVITNPSSDAITRINGHIISEGQRNNIIWNIGNNTGTYVVPFGYGSANYLPLSFTKSAGSGSGQFTFSTYHTGWQNSSELPNGITNLYGNSEDNSAFVLDRFWQIKASGYTAKPALTSLVFTYLDIEHTVPNNSIVEGLLQAQRWNDNTQTWSGYISSGTVDPNKNTVTIASLPAAEMYNWWVLVDKAFPLPVILLDFTAVAKGKNVLLNWATATEQQNKSFTLQRSRDAINFVAIATMQGAGNSARRNDYNYLDTAAYKGVSFYRLKQTDQDGTFSFSPTRRVFISNEETSSISYFPNPVTEKKFIIDFGNNKFKMLNFILTNSEGKIVEKRVLSYVAEKTTIQLNKSLAPGIYTLQLFNLEMRAQQQLLIQ